MHLSASYSVRTLLNGHAQNNGSLARDAAAAVAQLLTGATLCLQQMNYEASLVLLLSRIHDACILVTA